MKLSKMILVRTFILMDFKNLKINGKIRPLPFFGNREVGLPSNQKYRIAWAKSIKEG